LPVKSPAGINAVEVVGVSENQQLQSRPRARTDKLVVRRFGGEVMVYDRELDHASCLNGFAADVWERCDGQRSVAEIAHAIAQEKGKPVDERAVWLAVEDLSRARLLQERAKAPAAVFGEKGRRRLRQALGAAAAAIPAVVSILIPTVAGAQSVACLGIGSACVNSAQCCSLNCSSFACGPPVP
jgi:hypothetical protein